MSCRSTIWFACVSLVLLPATGITQNALPKDSLDRARTWTRLLLANKADSLWATTNNPLPNGPFSSHASLAAFLGDFFDRAGQAKPAAEQWVWRGGNRQFWVTVTPERMPEPLVIRWVMLGDGRFGGFGVNPQSQAPPIDSGGPVIRVP